MDFFYVFILHELEDFKGKIVLYMAFISAVAIAVIVAFLNISNFDAWATNTVKLIEESSVSGTFFGMDLGTQNAQNIINQAIATEGYKYIAYGIIPMILQFIALIIPFYRIRTGELKQNPRSTSLNRKCSNCGFDIPQYSETCPKCGQYYGAAPDQQTQSALKFCPECGHKNEESKTFCEECGTQF